VRADLHIHTTASDGTWDPADVVREVKKAGIGAFAVTDHDSVRNVDETARLAKKEGLLFVPGVELNTTKEGHNIHILGYGIDTKNKRLLELCDHNESLLRKKDDDSILLLVKEGWPISMEEFRSYSYDRKRGGWKALAYLQDKGLCGDVNDFFGRIFTAEHHLAFPVFATVKDAIDAIHGAGGLALCAHLASSFHGSDMKGYLELLSREKLDGLECYHSGHSREDSLYLAGWCETRHMCISGGSDCHGSFVASRHLGVPEIDTKMLILPGIL